MEDSYYMTMFHDIKLDLDNELAHHGRISKGYYYPYPVDDIKLRELLAIYEANGWYVATNKTTAILYIHIIERSFHGYSNEWS